MAIRERLSGNEAVATAMKQINPDTVAAYPITPSTEVPTILFKFCRKWRCKNRIYCCRK